MLYFVRHEIGGEGQRWKARTIYKEIAVLTVCKICYFLSLPLPRFQNGAQQVRRSYLYNFLGRLNITFWVDKWKKITCRKRLFRGSCCIHLTFYSKMRHPLEFFAPLLWHPGDGPEYSGKFHCKLCFSGQGEKMFNTFNTVYSASKGNCRKVSCLEEHNTQGASHPWVNKQGNYRIFLWRHLWEIA